MIGEAPQRCVVSAALLTLLALPRTAEARDPAAAEALFRTGRDLLAQGNFAEACPKFDASFTLDPTAGTLLNMARCREHEGKLAAAWADYKRALVLNQETPGAERRKTLADLAEQAIRDLEPRLPRLVLRVEGRARGARVERDGVVVPEGSFGVELPIDPGDHEIVATLAGVPPFRQAVTVAEAEHREVTISFGPEAGAPAGTSLAAPEGSRARGIPAWIFVTGGVGLVSVGTGIAFRIDGLAAEGRIEDACGPERRCDPDGGYDPADDNQTKNVDFGLFVGFTVAGGAAIVATVVGAIVEATTDDDGRTAYVAPDGSLGVRF